MRHDGQAEQPEGIGHSRYCTEEKAGVGMDSDSIDNLHFYWNKSCRNQLVQRCHLRINIPGDLACHVLDHSELERY